MFLQPDNLDGDPQIPKGHEFVPASEQVAILERMFCKAPPRGLSLNTAFIRSENKALWEAVKPILDYRAEDTANLDDFMACHHVMTILNNVKMKLEFMRCSSNNQQTKEKNNG